MLNTGPPKPRYTLTWDVHLVQKYLDCLGKTKLLPLKLLSIKLAMFFALSCPERAGSLAKLGLRHCRVAPKGVFFHTCVSENARLSTSATSSLFCFFPTQGDSAPLALCALILMLHETYIQSSCHLNQTHCFLCQTT